MTNRNQMTRICMACGEARPLAAFLIISGSAGTHYGQICSTCRSAGITEKKKSAEDDRYTTPSSGGRIGLKERSFIEKEKRKELLDAQEQHKDMLEKRDIKKTADTDKKDLKEKTERDHRRTYLDVKNTTGFLGQKLPAGTISRTPPPQEKVSVDLQQEKQTVETSQRNLEVNAKETSKKTFNLTTQFVDAQAGEVGAHSATFLAFQDSLEFTPFKTIRERLKKNTAPEKTEKAAAKEPLLNFVERTWGPSRKR